MIITVFLFAIMNLVVFWIFRLRSAVAICFFGGWLLLPIARYPESTITPEYFTVDVIGVALPSNLGVTKGIIIPVLILFAITIRSPRFWRSMRLTWIDYCVFLFCLWPLSLLVTSELSFSTIVGSALYLTASWAGTWLIGRLMFNDKCGREELVGAIACSGVALLPIGIIEGIFGPCFYGAIYGEHAFLLEGSSRYLGHRPLAFFEHGNQYGIWMAIAAFAWIVIFRTQRFTDRRTKLAVPVVTAAAVASQSVGAIALLIVGVVAFYLPVQRFRQFGLIACFIFTLTGAVYASGIISIEQVARNTRIGQKMIQVLMLTKRSTIGYRIDRDQKALSMIHQAPLSGYGVWDWWRPLGSHPWGLPLLLAGQFGVVSLILSMTAIFGATLRAITTNEPFCIPIAIIIFMAAFDGVLNSYIYFPAILAAGALVSVSKTKGNWFTRWSIKWRPTARPT